MTSDAKSSHPASSAPRHQIVIEGETVFNHLLCGSSSDATVLQNSLTLIEFIDQLRALLYNSRTISIGPAPPDLRIRDIRQQNGLYIIVVEIEPSVRSFQWLADHSPAPFGANAIYRHTTLAFPWQYFFIPISAQGHIHASSVYYRRTPLLTLSDPLLECSYYNCSVDSYDLHCWICQQYMTQPPPGSSSLLSLAASLISQFFGGGFNQSSETHEGMSFWTLTRQQTNDQNLRSTEAWEQASTKQGISFALQAGWLESPMTVESVYQELAGQGSCWHPTCAADIASIINHKFAEQKRSHRRRS